MRCTHILIALVAACFVGCAASPNHVQLAKGGIKGYGSIFGVFTKHEQITAITIHPRELSEDTLHDLWIGFSSTNQMTFAEITEEAIKKISVPATNYYSEASPQIYFLDGYSFDFKGAKFVEFGANKYGYPPKEITAFTKVGSRKSGCFLSLPCSVDDFEKVFGKADEIARSFSR